MKIDKKLIIIGILTAILITLFAGSVLAEEERVTVIGRSFVEDNNLAEAYETALDNGLRRAVEKTVGTYIDAETKTENMVLIEDKILRSTRGYVKRYNVVNEDLEDGVYFLELEVVVSTADLSDDLQALELNIKRSSNPRVAIIMGQNIERYTMNNQLVATEMRSKFLEAGFLLVDPSEVEKSLDADQKRSIIAGDYTLAAEIGNRLEADIIITGDARAHYTDIGRQFSDGFGSGLVSYDTDIRAEAINTSTGEITAANSSTGRGVNITRSAAARESLLKAVDNIAKLMIDDVADSLIIKDRTVSLQISGLESVKDLQALEDALADLDRVKRVYFREYGGRLASFNLDVENDIRLLNLAADLEQKLELNFRVDSITENRLTLAVQN